MKTILTNVNKIHRKNSLRNTWLIASLLIGLTCIGKTVYGQDALKVLDGTFDGKQITGLDNLHVDRLSNFQIKLDSANTAKYKVVFQFEDFEWESEPPVALNQLLPNIESFAKTRTEGFADDPDLINSWRDNLQKTIEMVNDFPAKIRKLSSSDSIWALAKRELKKLGYTNSLQYDTLLFQPFQYQTTYIIALYESLKEFNNTSQNGSSDNVLVLASLKGLYDQLKNSNYIRNLKLIVDCAKKPPVNFAESDIHFPDKEVTTVHIVVLNQFNLADTICSYVTDIYRTGIFKLDFSTGIGINSLVKPTYFIGNNGTPYISKENGRDADISVMALMHANWRFSRIFAFGPVAGVSVSTFDANTGFVLGLSSSWGTRNSISFSAGGIMGKSYKLSSRISSDGNVADIPLESGITDIPKVDAVHYGWFVSVTYNLTRTKRKGD